MPVNHVDEDHGHIDLKSSTYCQEGEPRWGREGGGGGGPMTTTIETLTMGGCLLDPLKGSPVIENCRLTKCGFVLLFDFRTRMLTIHTDTGSPSKP